jgi:flavin-dependent dehydrogenase
MEIADVVVIGAGANGNSTAFHLAKAGVKRVVVVERQLYPSNKVLHSRRVPPLRFMG